MLCKCADPDAMVGGECVILLLWSRSSETYPPLGYDILPIVRQFPCRLYKDEYLKYHHAAPTFSNWYLTLGT